MLTLTCCQLVAVSADYPITTLLQALSFIETGTKVAPLQSSPGDTKIGKAGEVTRYQMLQHVWQRHAKGTKLVPTKPADAYLVANLELNDRLTKFRQLRQRSPTLREIYVIWNSPTKAYGGKLPSARVEKLSLKFETAVHQLTTNNYDTAPAKH